MNSTVPEEIVSVLQIGGPEVWIFGSGVKAYANASGAMLRK